MKKCTYEIKSKGITFNSELELNDYIKNNIDDFNHDENIIYSLADKKEINIAKVKEINQAFNQMSNEDKESALLINDYLVTEHQLGGGQTERMNPEYILENRIENTVAQILKKNPSYTEAFARADIANTIKNEEKMLELGKWMHRLLTKGWRSTASPEFNAELDSIEQYKDVLGNIDDTSKRKISDSISEIIRLISLKHGKTTSFPNLNFIADDFLGRKVSGKIDLLLIDEDGKAHIYDFKLSTKAFADWDSAKMLNTNYQLGAMRQMLAANGINIQDCTLNVIPLTIPFGNVNRMQTDIKLELLNPKTQVNNKLNFFQGDISLKLKKYIPSTLSNADIENVHLDNTIIDQLGTLFPRFNFESQQIKVNADELYEKASQVRTSNGEFRFYNKLKAKAEFAKTEEELKEKIDEYIKDLDAQKHTVIDGLYEQLDGFIKTGTKPENLFGRNTNAVLNEAISYNFDKYMDGTWNLIKIDALKSAGIIGFQSENGMLEFVVISTNRKNIAYKLPKGDTLLGKFLSNEKSRLALPSVLEATTSNIELMKVLTVLNSIPEIFNGYTLGDVKFLNYLEGKADSKDLNLLISNFNALAEKGGIESNFKNNKIKPVETLDYIYNNLNSVLKISTNKSLVDILNSVEREDLIDLKLETLMDLRQKILDMPNQAYLKNKTPTEMINFNTPEEYSLYLITLGIAYYSGITNNGDYIASQLGISGANISDALKSPFTYTENTRDSKGNKIEGFLGGLTFATASTLPSKDLHSIINLVSIGNQRIRNEYEKALTDIIPHTKKYYKDRGYSEAYQHIIGDTYKLHENFYKRMADNTLDPSMMFKNPYDESESLLPAERDYLKRMLWEINKRRLGLSFEEKQTDYKAANTLEKVMKAGDKYFEVPLLRGTDLARMKSTTLNNVLQGIKDKVNEVRDFVDPRDLTEEQRIDIVKQKNNYQNMYNQFRMSENSRSKMISKHGVGFFETNLDRITLEFTYADIKESIMNNVLTKMNSAIYLLKFYAKQSGDDISSTLQYFQDYIQSNIYNEPIISAELTDAVKWVEAAKGFTNKLLMPFRPAMLVKELTMGTIANVSRAFTQIYGENSFNIGHLTEAYKVMLGRDNKFSRDFSKVDGINNVYGVVNMDMNVLVNKTRTDRVGCLNAFSEWMYFTASHGDYVNRMTLFIAQMIHDNVWDAHTVNKDGKLIYDFNKDGRFAEYNKFKDSKGYTSKTFLEQKSLYKIILDQFKMEGYTREDGSELQEGDNLPQAYTVKDKESLKSFADMAYGFYDHERKSMFNKTATGIIFMQFMTFWTAKKALWLTKPGITDNNQGMWKIKKIMVDGEEKTVYKREFRDENGIVDHVEETTETDGTLEPVQYWEGNPHVGLFYALTHTFRDLSHGRFKDAFADAKRNNRSKQALHDILAVMFYAFIARLLFGAARSLAGADPNAKKGDDVSLMVNSINLLEKSQVKAYGEFNPVSNIFGGFSWEPAFASKVTNIVTGAQAVIFGDDDFLKYAKKNIQMLENFNL